MLRRLIALGSIVGTTMLGQRLPDFTRVDRSGNVTILSVDSAGIKVECDVLKFANEKGQDFAANFDGLTGSGIPFGTYRYTLKSRNGLPPTTRPLFTCGSGGLTVRSSENTTLAIGKRAFGDVGSIDHEGTSAASLRGRVNGLPTERNTQDEPLWIRLSPLLKDSPSAVAAVQADGQFTIGEAPVGRYILAVVAGSRVLHVQEVIFSPSARVPFVVSIPKQPNQTLIVE